MNAGRIWFAAAILVAQPATSMSFFVTSVGSGRGGNLGGLLGADRQCPPRTGSFTALP